MRRSRARAAALLVLVLALALGSTIIAAGDEVPIPYGKYEGSAAASTKGKAFAITVYVNEGKNGMVDVTVNAPGQLPFPVTVQSTPQAVYGGYDLPVSAEVAAIGLAGDGILRLRAKDAQWVAYGSGSGSLRGKDGSGIASATRVEGESGAYEQVSEALIGFVSGGKPSKVTSPAEYVESEWVPPADVADVGTGIGEQAPPETVSAGEAEQAPLSGGESAGVWFFMVFVFLLLFFL
jgi:hypothetical protein